MRIEELKPFVDKTVTLRMNSGETATVKVTSVDEEYADLIAAVMETSCPDQYRGACALHTFAAADIVSVEIPERSESGLSK